MKIEYEATFKNIDKEDVRARLKKAVATCKKKEFLQKRSTFKSRCRVLNYKVFEK